MANLGIEPRWAIKSHRIINSDGPVNVFHIFTLPPIADVARAIDGVAKMILTITELC